MLIASFRVVLVVVALGFAGCAFTLTYDDFGDQNANAGGGDAGCVSKTCASLGADCGNVPDGCGTILDCGQCQSGETCGAAGDNLCGTGTCTPKTCAEQGAFCGPASDGCGNTIECGGCAEPKVCGALKPNECGCATLITCDDSNCGLISDGCGGFTECGACPGGYVCAGQNTTPDPAGSESNTCVPLPCSDAFDCSQLGSGTGIGVCGVFNCGGTTVTCNCPPEQTCGASGNPNQCG